MNSSPTQESPPRGWRDDPISTLTQDRLDRAPVARRAARLIADNHSRESSVVYGLEGPWGSGKTSVIQLITIYLTQDDNNDNPWHVVSFTPWATTGTEGLLSEFFATLATIAPKRSAQKFREMVASYADIARPLASLIPMAGSAMVEASRSLERRLSKPWKVAFEELAAALRELDIPVLVVVDDIDRLQPSELLDLLKVVRLLGRFPGVDFLLAYDEQTLVETLQDPGRGSASKARARSFMEKIVQYPLTIPPLLTSKIVRMLAAGITEIVTQEQVDSNFDTQRFSDIILSTMPSQLSTPRAIERFLAQVREQFRAHDVNEMNNVDLILATFLRVQFPDVFTQLQSRKADLPKGRGPYSSLARRDDKKPDWDSLVSTLERSDDRHDALTVLGAIFPAVRDTSPPGAPPGRFAHPDYFDRYLAQAIPEGDIPDARIGQALEQAASSHDDELRALITDTDSDRVTLALSKIRARYPDVTEERSHTGPRGPVTLALLQAAMTLVNEIGDDRLTTLISTGDQLRWWSATLLRQLLNADPTAAVDQALLACADTQRLAHVLNTATRDLDGLNQETQDALNNTLEREIVRIIPMLLSDLRGRDQSDTQTGVAFLYTLVADSSGSEDLRNQIAAGLEANDFTVEDVAARLVGLSYVIGGTGRPTSASFDGDLFTKLTGIRARSGNDREIGEWPDNSWQRRREFAAQFILAAEDEPNPREADPDGEGHGVDSPSDVA